VFPLSQPGHLPGLIRLERGFVFKTLTLKSLLGFSTMVEVDWKHLTYISQFTSLTFQFLFQKLFKAIFY